MKQKFITIPSVPVWLMAMAFAMSVCNGASAQAVTDPTGILKKPVPDKLVVLTFDDGPASHYNVVRPILKQFGFGGTFYVCDFDSFRTRKDWYLTWRQMREMAREGFEIGNHTSGHVGGAAIRPFLTMEDALLANGIPKPITIAWPVYQSNPATYPDLAANGYIFGRGGYRRPYRPTVDNPFDIPGMEPRTVPDFVKTVRQAAGGRIVVLTYHGVPDIEHPPVTLDPAIFRAQMQYLKNNHYKVIAMRDLVEYINPAQAAKLPPTSRDYKPTGTEPLASEEKPGVAVEVSKATTKRAAPATKPEAKLNLPELIIPSNAAPITLNGDRQVNIPKGRPVDLRNVLSGPGRLVKTGAGELRLADVKNTYGGTWIHGGTLTVRAAKDALGNGPVTLEDGAMFQISKMSGTNPLILNGGAFHATDGFGSRWDGDIQLNGDVLVSAYHYLELNTQGGGIHGPGDLTMAGNIGPWGHYINAGKVILDGTNTYTGPTVVQLGTLVLAKTVALYDGDTARWTAEHLTVHKAATLTLHCGGPGEFTGAQLRILLKHLTDTRSTNGLMGGAVLCLDTGNAKAPFVLNADLTDAAGSDGGGFDLRKSGNGTLVLTGKNTFTGSTHIERGMLSVSSLNRIGKGKMPYSSLGAPAGREAGEILFGDGDGTVPQGDGACGLIYTGSGETTDRDLNLAGRDSVITLEQAGSGQLKLGGKFIISGYGANKQIVLGGDTAGTGELAGDLFDPYDRAGKAKTSLTKIGSGTWTLSGTNTYSGLTSVKQGTLRIASAKSLAKETEVQLAPGAKLALDFSGEANVAKLTIDRKPMPPGKYSSANCATAINGNGTLIVR